MTLRKPNRQFWSGRRVLLTGHTGFKGSWMSLWLEGLGASVMGFSLAPDHEPDLHGLLAPFNNHVSTISDLRDAASLTRCINAFTPQIVLHMAAQPLVRRSYADPSGTFATNLQGTVNLLEALRSSDQLQAIVVVTTDKVYANNGDGRPFLEDDRLGGHDPYSASKAAAEIAVQSYAHSFFDARGIAVATARAGNVVGGGDWSEDRLVPDVWRALHAGRQLELRYPAATRPWQHVLDPLLGYLLYAEDLANNLPALPRALNLGPNADEAVLSVANVADTISHSLGMPGGWRLAEGPQPPEMPTLALDATLAHRSIGWEPRLTSQMALDWTADWYRNFDMGKDMRAFCQAQLERYEEIA